ncbi:MAG: 50S ribosomal protein L20 [Chloroflexi bacterium]|nr:50S ribosomal protein L20 [Chloroflexota bacterium]
MTRIKRGVVKHQRHAKVLEGAKGHYSTRHRQYRRAHESVLHAGQYAYNHRRTRKRDMRRLWILRINAACRALGITYNRFIHSLAEAGLQIDRKNLAELAVHDPNTFAQLVEKVRQPASA